jgi:hypothetical protein
MLPVNGARSEVLYGGSSGSTSESKSATAIRRISHTPPTVIKKVIVKDGMVVVIGVIRQAAGHY